MRSRIYFILPLPPSAFLSIPSAAVSRRLNRRWASANKCHFFASELASSIINALFVNITILIHALYKYNIISVTSSTLPPKEPAAPHLPSPEQSFSAFRIFSISDNPPSNSNSFCSSTTVLPSLQYYRSKLHSRSPTGLLPIAIVWRPFAFAPQVFCSHPKYSPTRSFPSPLDSTSLSFLPFLSSL